MIYDLVSEIMSDITLSGSCLCGSVAYELQGDVRRFYHCHCERCRKASGAAHASNIIMRLHSIAWTAGEQLARRYKVPEAERFAVVFCVECGSPLPRVSPDGEFVVVAANAAWIGAEYGIGGIGLEVEFDDHAISYADAIEATGKRTTSP